MLMATNGWGCNNTYVVMTKGPVNRFNGNGFGWLLGGGVNELR